MEVPTRKDLRKKKSKPEAKKPEWPRCARPKAVLIKPVERVSYAAILKDIKKRVKPDELGVVVQGIRETRYEVTHINSGGYPAGSAKKVEVNRYYCSLGFVHMAVNCRGPDQSANQ